MITKAKLAIQNITPAQKRAALIVAGVTATAVVATVAYRLYPGFKAEELDTESILETFDVI